MLSKKTIALAGCTALVALVGACSSDKVLPKGERIAVLDPVAAIKPDVVNTTGKVTILHGSKKATMLSIFSKISKSAQTFKNNGAAALVKAVPNVSF